MTDIVALEAVNAHRWSVMHVKADRLPSLHKIALRLSAPDTKARFQGVTDRSGELVVLKPGVIHPVPWWFIAIVSEREYGPDQHGNMRWDKQLGHRRRADAVRNIQRPRLRREGQALALPR
jgi:hypothetical protein